MLKGIEYLRQKLSHRRGGILRKYEYYNQKMAMEYFPKLVPTDYRWMRSVTSWCTIAVDAIANRLEFKGFENDNFNIGDIFEANNPDILFDSATLGALITSCDFIYISKSDDDEMPKLQVIDGSNATGEIDATTYLLNEGYAVLERDTNDGVLLEAYFTREYTEFYPKDAEPYRVENPTGQCLLVPVINRPSAMKPFGRSIITRSAMSLVQNAMRTIVRSEVSSEFNSAPQRYVLGLDDDAEFNGRVATMSSFLAFGKDEDGDKPTVGQFPQGSMAPFIEYLKMLASMFAGEMGLTTDDIGFLQSNPQSEGSIKASHVNLQTKAEKSQKVLGTCFLNVGFVAACLRDGRVYNRSILRETKPIWKPAFPMDSSAIASLGDAYQKLQVAGVPEEEIKELLNI